ncbi:FxsA family protein [Roseospira navarrensis]|uniref:FxsA family protein n=1 Tax=Roseospira navarrensis TaxID=140058 RepID=A0A7X1ZFQ7_9PROT|nr:FxsA family protein [Roseospira navarrensis]MQX37488.1 FxsA family protein [Roseospira navarrensis]
MPFLLLLAFIGVPLLEIAVFIQVGGLVGLGWTLALVILTAIIGTLLLRAQGVATLNRARTSLDRGEMPVREVFDGACLLVGGALLLTPGFVTDTLGFLLLLPPVRSWLLTRLKQSGRLHVHGAGMHMGGGMGGGRPGQGPRPGGRGPVIDGDYEDIGDRDDSRPDLGEPGPPRPTRWGGLGGAGGGDDGGASFDPPHRDD